MTLLCVCAQKNCQLQKNFEFRANVLSAPENAIPFAKTPRLVNFLHQQVVQQSLGEGQLDWELSHKTLRFHNDLINGGLPNFLWNCDFTTNR
jgi:hypothetical protein